ncbi:MAG: choice-of-anchor B family protein, partial [Bacteroidia bacterium]
NTLVSGFHAMDVLSLANPANPAFISTLINPAFWHVHDVYVKNDTAYCSAGNEGFYIYNYSNPANPVLIQSITSYPEQGYNHSSWVSEDGNILVFADENWGKGLKLYDISDLSNPQLLSVFRSNLLNIQPPNTQFGSIAHNPFIINNKVVISYYHEGVQIFDISDPSNPVQTHYYDTYPQNIDYDDYKGCWGVYPYLPSGTIIASDIENGLFLLNGSGVILGYSNPLNATNIKIYPNPFQEDLKIQLPSDIKGETLISVKDVTGRIVKEEKYYGSETEILIDGSGLIPGVYILSIRSNDFISSQKMIKSQ